MSMGNIPSWARPEVLRAIREAAGLRYEDVERAARRLKGWYYAMVTRQDLKKWEEGQAQPDFEHLETLAAIYHCPVGYFFLEASELPADIVPFSHRGLVSVRDIVRTWLKGNRADGLCREDGGSVICHCSYRAVFRCGSTQDGSCLAARRWSRAYEPLGEGVTVRDMVCEYLKSSGCHGLYEPASRCACILSELFKCEAGDPRCYVAKLRPVRRDG